MILLDTHAAFWLESDATKLSRSAVAAIKEARKAGTGLGISDFTLLEPAILVTKARIKLSVSLESFLQEIEKDFRIFPISSGACAMLASFPSTFPNDPADRIITATALVAGLPLVKADRKTRESRIVKTIW